MLEFTWFRNRSTDLVEFVANEEGAILGRVVHPIHSMQWDEFIYCAYTLAVEVDRLEYVISRSDRY